MRGVFASFAIRFTHNVHTQCYTSTLVSTGFQGKYGEADALYVRAIGIGDKVLGAVSPHLATWLSNRASVLEKQVGYSRELLKRPHLSVMVSVHG